MRRILTLFVLLMLLSLCGQAQDARFFRERSELPTTCYSTREIIVVDNETYRCTVPGNPGTWTLYLKNVFTAKGDLLTRSATAPARQAVGSNGQVLTADSTQANGIKWNAVVESTLSFSDVTTLDVSITKHGFVPKAPNDNTKFLRGDGSWAAIPSLDESFISSKTEITSVADDELLLVRHNGTDGTHANGALVFTAKPNYGETFVIGTETFTFWNGSGTQPTRPIFIPTSCNALSCIGSNVAGALSVFSTFVENFGNANGVVTFRTVATGAAANSTPFSESAANMTLTPFSGGANAIPATLTKVTKKNLLGLDTTEQLQIGDASGSGNSTRIIIDDSGGQYITFYSTGTINATTIGTFNAGDVDGEGNSTTLTISDSDEAMSVNATTLTLQTHTALIGDTGLGNNATRLWVDDDAQKIELRAPTGITIDTTGGVKPACASGTRGRWFTTQGGPGVADKTEQCMKRANDAYAWVAVVTAP